MKEKQVQISESAFLRLYMALCEGIDLDLTNVAEELKIKYRALQKRRAYTQMHDMSLDEVEREKARQTYLNLAEINKDFRY